MNLNGVVAVTSFGSKASNYQNHRNLPQFSFLTVDTLKSYGTKIRAGVLSHTGMMSNPISRRDFDIALTENEVRVKFAKATSTGIPTVVAFPNWFSEGSKFPRNEVDLAFVLDSIGPTNFKIRSAGSTGMAEQRRLGFNFVVIGSEMPQKNVKHGVVFECTSFQGWFISSIHGASVVAGGECSSPEVTEFQPGAVGVVDRGVKVQFDYPFYDIPSVIVTPYMPEWDGTGVPRCMVETITESFTRVKCVLIKSGGVNTYQPIPFSFVAVGTPSHESVSVIFRMLLRLCAMESNHLLESYLVKNAKAYQSRDHTLGKAGRTLRPARKPLFIRPRNLGRCIPRCHRCLVQHHLRRHQGGSMARCRG